MAEIQLTRIRSLYGEAKGYLDAIKNESSSGPYTVPRSIVDKFNTIVDEVSNTTQIDYSRSKIPASELRNIMSVRLVKPLLAAFVSRLELEYGFNQSNNNTPGIAIFNDNSNKVTVQTNYTITNLIEQETSDEAKEKLRILEKELKKDNKDWNVIKSVLIWIINFSAELFLKVLPTILEKYH